mgnify:CR=1 FL=1
MAYVFNNAASPLNDKMPFWLPMEICEKIDMHVPKLMMVSINYGHIPSTFMHFMSDDYDAACGVIKEIHDNFNHDQVLHIVPCGIYGRLVKGVPTNRHLVIKIMPTGFTGCNGFFNFHLEKRATHQFPKIFFEHPCDLYDIICAILSLNYGHSTFYDGFLTSVEKYRKKQFDKMEITVHNHF